MTINEIVRKYNIKLCEFSPELWDRAGFYYAPLRTILEEELSCCDKEEIENFNYVQFMKKYDLVSMVDEELIKEEFLKLIN